MALMYNSVSQRARFHLSIDHSLVRTNKDFLLVLTREAGEHFAASNVFTVHSKITVGVTTWYSTEKGD